MVTHLLDGLNDAQRAAVTQTEGFVRVIAGAGSGKTRALSHRFAYLVLGVGVLPSNILCVTFTNKSANEMRQRIRLLTGDNDAGYISTFHGFCVSILQEDANAVSYPKSFLVLDNADIDQMLKIIYEERGLTLRDMTFSKARDMIEIRKGITEPDYYEYMIAMSPAELKRKYDEATDPRDIIFYGYLYNEKKCFGLDYNDLIFYALYIFRHSDEIRLKWQKRLMYVMVDEFQDIDKPQYELMRVLCGYHKNLFIVGDPDQTIYTWRGADVRYLLNFEQDFPGTKTIMMTENYRSTPEILSAANALIECNKLRVKKSLTATRPHGQPVRYHHAATAGDEARFIVSEVRALNAAGTPLSNVTVLYRAHYITRTLEEVFLAEQLPYVIYSGVQFFDRMEIKDALSYLRLIAYRDDLSFLRIVNVPKRNIGERRIRFLKEYAEANHCLLYDALTRTLGDDLFRNTKAKRFTDMIERLSADCFSRPVSELLAAVLHESGYEEALRTEGAQERLDNLAELRQAVHEYEISCGEESVLESYLSHVALMTNRDGAAEGKQAVKLMTVHTAKGLEFPCVFLAAMSEGIFPSKKTATVEGMEEERRLAFVAVTRAQERLYLTDCEGRNLDDSFRYPSRFLFDMGNSIRYDVELSESLIRGAHLAADIRDARIADAALAPPLPVGCRIAHPIMGEGTILGVDTALHAFVIQFDALDTPRNIAFRAPLTKLE